MHRQNSRRGAGNLSAFKEFPRAKKAIRYAATAVQMFKLGAAHLLR